MACRYARYCRDCAGFEDYQSLTAEVLRMEGAESDARSMEVAL